MKRFFILFILLVGSTNAAIIGVSPSVVRFQKMAKGGYAQTGVTVSTSSEIPITARLTPQGDMEDWVRFDPQGEKFTFSKSEPYRFLLIIEPPVDTPNGNYTGSLRIRTDEIGSIEEGAGSSVLAELSLRLRIEVIGEQIVDCRAGAIQTSSTEIGEPFTLQARVYNDGNVRLRPEIKVDIYDKMESMLLDTKTLYGDEILPTTDKTIKESVSSDLDEGQYFAHITFPQCGVTQKTTFDVLERGAIADSGQLIGIKTNEVSYVNDPLPIVPMFKNSGSRSVLAQFKGEIRDLDTDKIVTVLESDELQVESGELKEFSLFYIPEKKGMYQVSGRVVYNNKITFDEKSRTFNIISRSKFESGWIFMIILYIIIGFVILIMIGKIKKAKSRH